MTIRLNLKRSSVKVEATFNKRSFNDYLIKFFFFVFQYIPKPCFLKRGLSSAIHKRGFGASGAAFDKNAAQTASGGAAFV